MELTLEGWENGNVGSSHSRYSTAHEKVHFFLLLFALSLFGLGAFRGLLCGRLGGLSRLAGDLKQKGHPEAIVLWNRFFDNGFFCCTHLTMLLCVKYLVPICDKHYAKNSSLTAHKNGGWKAYWWDTMTVLKIARAVGLAGGRGVLLRLQKPLGQINFNQIKSNQIQSSTSPHSTQLFKKAKISIVQITLLLEAKSVSTKGGGWLTIEGQLLLAAGLPPPPGS